MSTENLDCTYSLPAAADLSTNQGYPIVVNTSGQVALATAGGVAHGHLHNAPKSGDQARFVHNGKVVKAKLGTGGIATAGLKLFALSDGYGADTTSGHSPLGISLTGGNGGDVIPMLLLPGLPVN